MDALKRAFDRAVSTQSKVGTDENAVADEESRLDAMRRAAAARLSSEEDTNMAAAITGLSAADTAHKAALGAAATINKLSLLDYL
jgi:flagellar hook-associated protein 3 FlgL